MLSADATDEEIDAAATESITLIEPPLRKVRAPHFINIVREVAAGVVCPDDPTVCTKLDTDGYKIITTLDEFLDVLERHSSGDTVAVTVLRGGTTIELSVRLGAAE